MKKFLILALFLSILIFPSWVHADGPYLNIPPTNAFDKAHSQNGTINAVNFSMPINFIGRNGVNVTSNNSTHTIIIIGNGTGPKGATGATGSFVCNDINNCVNLNGTQTINGSKSFFSHIIVNGTLIGDIPSAGLQQFTIQPLDSNNYFNVPGVALVPKNGTSGNEIVIYAESPPINSLLLQTTPVFNTITGSQLNPNAVMNLIQLANSTQITEQINPALNKVIFQNSTNGAVFLSNIKNPILNQDAVTKYWHDHFLGNIGNLTQNKCSNLELLAYQQSNQTWICSSGSSHGTYNETLANNVLINSGGNKINYINGTGNPVHIVNSNSGQQVNVTISNNPTFTTRTIDLSSSAYNTVLDNNTGTISITATSKPTSPQFVQTISAGNIPTDTTDVKDYTVILTVGGKNTNATTGKGISVIPTRNGVEVDTTRTVGVVNGNFWESGYYFSSSAVTAGDQIGLKMWCSSSPCTSGGGLDFRYATIYIVPRQFVSTHDEMAILPSATTLTLSGAIGGVTYSTSTPSAGINGVGSVVDPILGVSASTSIPNNLVSIKGQNLSELGNSNQFRSTTDIGITPAQQAASNLMSVSFAKFVRINTLS